MASELIEYLINEAGVKSPYARQIIYRSKTCGDICSTEPVSFLRNQYLYFLPGQNIKNKIKQISPDLAVTYNRIYLAFVELDGFLLWSEFLKISAGAIDPESAPGHKTANEIYTDLKSLGLIKPIKYFNNTSIVIADESWAPSVNASDLNIYKRLQEHRLEEHMTSDLLKWLERTNIAGWNSTYIHSDDEDDKGVNGYYWDAHGFSYLWGLYSITGGDPLLQQGSMKKGSLILIDSLLTRQMKLHDIKGFIARMEIQYGRIRNVRNFRIIPVCFVLNMDPEVFKIARSKGILIITLAEVFGSRIAEIIDSIRKIDPRNVDPTALAKIIAIADETGQDGKFGAMKGYLFNFLVASIFNTFGWPTRIGVKYEANGRKCECDVVIRTNDDLLIVCECKGITSDKFINLGETEDEPDSVKKFFEKTVPIIEDATQDSNIEGIIPVFITSGRFTLDASEYLNKKNDSKRITRLIKRIGRFPYKIYYDYEQLIDFFLSNTKNYAIHKQVLVEFYKTRTINNKL